MIRSRGALSLSFSLFLLALPARAFLPARLAASASRRHAAAAAAAHQGHHGRRTLFSMHAAAGGHGHGHGASAVDASGFVQGEMRGVAMRLHTKDQAPKEGQKKPAGKKFTDWTPTLGGYLQFLVDSRAVYGAFEEAAKSRPELAAFVNTGLERSQALQEDIAWMQSKFKLEEPAVGEQGAAYAAFIRELARDSVPAFTCHFYNHYFAHTAGGIMIGKRVSDAILGGEALKFYQWEGDVRATLDSVRQKIDDMATEWTREEKDACLAETERTFQYGGSLLKSIAV